MNDVFINNITLSQFAMLWEAAGAYMWLASPLSGSSYPTDECHF